MTSSFGKQRCVSCAQRYWQSAATHLCRQCEKELSDVARLTQVVALETKAHADAAAEQAARAEPKRPREVTIKGQVFEVVFDGTK